MINIFYVAVTRAQDEGTDSAEALRLRPRQRPPQGRSSEWTDRATGSMLQKGEGGCRNIARFACNVSTRRIGVLACEMLKRSSTQQDGILAILGNSCFRTADLLLYSHDEEEDKLEECRRQSSDDDDEEEEKEEDDDDDNDDDRARRRPCLALVMMLMMRRS